MGILAQWRKWRNACRFDKIGAGCELPASALDVKGQIELGAQCVVRANVVLRTHQDGRILVGDRVELSDYAMIASNARIEVGADTYVGPHCVIRDINHVFQGTDVHWRLTPHITKPITIGPNCYLGARSYIMPGVTIGAGAVVAPGSIITRDIGPCEVWAGAPSAQFIAHRTDPERGPARKRHAELLQLYGFDVAEDVTQLSPQGDAAESGEASAAAPPKAATPERAGRKTAATKRKATPAKQKPAAKATPKKASTAKKKPSTAPRRQPARKSAARSATAPPSARSGKQPKATKKASAETPAAVRKALSDASDVLKSFSEDQ